jgi:iron(III) transport system ATP-binding protein
MNHGVIEQVGTPLEVYREPRSPFVADFIGVMNFVAARVAAAGAVRIGSLELGCDVDGLLAGSEVTLAIRPEEVTVREGGGGSTPSAREGGGGSVPSARPDGGDNVVAARVEGVAFLGSFFRAELVAEAAPELRVRCDLPVDLVRRRAIAEGAGLAVELPRDRIRVYPGAIAHR